MTAVARVHPREWDGHRLLRFLTGLAMLALAFAAHLAPAQLETAAPAPAVVASVTASPPASSVTVVQPVEPILPEPFSLPVLVVAVVLIAALATRVRQVRGPPAR